MRTITVATIILTSIAVGASARWRVETTEDPMTGEKTAFAVSDWVTPTRSISFPYEDLEAQVVVRSDGERQIVFLYFTSLNLAGGETKDGYQEWKCRVKWDEDLTVHPMIRVFGEKLLYFKFTDLALEYLAEASTLLVELYWYQEGRVYFDFSLEGSSRAISEAAALVAK